MAATIPEAYLDLLTEPIHVIFTTVSPEGKPENSVVWCSWDGTHVLVNTVLGRRKANNVAADPNVALITVDPQNPYRWMDVRGVVEEVVEDADYSNINAHAKQYAGQDEYYGGVAPAEMKGTETRIIFKILPQRVVIYDPQG